MHEFHHGLGHVQHGCKNEVVLPLSLADSAIYSCSGPCPVSIICRSKANLAVCCSACSCRSSPFAFGKPVRPPWNARGAPLARVHHVPLPLASPCARCGTPEVRLWLSVFALSPCHVPLPLASPCARRGTPEVRPWLVSIMPLCLWQARAPAVERPRCAFGCLCLPCLHVMSLCLWQARAPAVERPRCAFGCLSLFLAFMSCFCLAFLTYML